MSRALVVCALLLGCGAKEAQDPHSLIGDYESGGEKNTKPAAPADRVATRAECKAAARRIEELALELVVKEEEDPEERAKLEVRRKQELQTSAFTSRIEGGTRDCLARETTRREATCIARAINDIAIDRCGKH